MVLFKKKYSLEKKWQNNINDKCVIYVTYNGVWYQISKELFKKCILLHLFITVKQKSKYLKHSIEYSIILLNYIEKSNFYLF